MTADVIAAIPLFHYRVPPPKESITEFGESPLENEHTGSARIYYSPCVIRRRSIVTPGGNKTKWETVLKNLCTESSGFSRARPFRVQARIYQAEPSRGVDSFESRQRLVQPIEDQRGVDDLGQTMTGKVRS